MLVTFVTRFPRLIVALFVILASAGGYFATQVPEAISIADQLDRDLPETKALLDLRQKFNDAGTLGFLIERPESGWQRAYVCRLHDEMAKLALSADRIRSMSSPLQIPRISHDGTKFLLSEAADQCTGTQDGEFDWSMVKQSPWSNLFLGKDQRWLAMIFQLHTLKDGELDKLDWLPAFASAGGKIAGGQPKWFGTPLQEWETRQGGQITQILNLLIALFIFLFMRVVFGTWRSAAVFWLTLGFTISIVYGGFYLSGGKQDLIFLCIFMLLVVASLEDFIFVTLDPAFLEGRHLDAFRAQALPTFLTSFTTMIGFMSLLVSDLRPIRVFGFWAGAGALVEWAAVMLLLPALIQIFPKVADWIKPLSPASKLKNSRWMKPVLAPIVTFATLAVFSMPLWGIRDFNVTQDPAKVFDADNPVQVAIRTLSESRGWIANVEAVFDKSATEETRARVFESLAKEKSVTEVDSFAGVFASVTKDVPDPALNRALLLPVKLSSVGKRYFAPATGDERAFVYLNTTDIREILRLKQTVTALCPSGECALGGDLVAFAEYSDKILSTLFESFFLSLLLVAAVLFAAAYWRGHRRVLIPILISAFWGPFALLFIIWATGQEVNFVTCILLSVLVGLTGDNAIQYLFGSRTLDNGAEIKGGASFLCALQMAGVCLLFLLSPFEPARGLGALLALGFGLSFFGDYFLLRSLLSLKWLRD